MLNKLFGTTVYNLAKRRFGIIETAGHVDVMSAHAGKHKGHRAFGLFAVGADQPFGITEAEDMLYIFKVAADCHSAMLKRLSTYLQRVRHITDIQFGM